MTEAGSVLILAVSGRALAAAARRAGYLPLVADCFADRDTRALAVRWRKLGGELSGDLSDVAVLEALAALNVEAPAPIFGLVYGAGIEARPGLLGSLERRWPILGNSAETLGRVKDPAIFFATLDGLGVPHPAISLTPPLDGTGWLRKRQGGSGGGHIAELASLSPLEAVAPSRLEGEGRGGGYSGRASAEPPITPHPAPARRVAAPSLLNLPPQGGKGSQAAGAEGNSAYCSGADELRVTPSPLEGEGWGEGYSGTEFAERPLTPHPAPARSASAPSLHNPGSSPGQALPPQGGKGSQSPTAETNAVYYFQRKVRGRSISTAFLADRAGVHRLGLSEQWTAPAPGRPMRYGGAVQPPDVGPRDAEAMWSTTEAVARAFELRGLGSADFLLTEEGPLLLEINARPGATIDVFDDVDAKLLAAHVAAVGGEAVHPPAIAPGARAAAIVHADRDLTIPADLDWPKWVADIPHPGERIGAARPICAVMAQAETGPEAKRLVTARVSAIVAKIKKPGGDVGFEECEGRPAQP